LCVTYSEPLRIAGLGGSDVPRGAVRDRDQTIVMVTHDPVAAAHADSVLFLADGNIVDRMDGPTAQSVLDRMKSFGD
ncbi:MAG: hypothetical protein V9G12_04390, partial [Microthrixaceae bacterium]